MKLIKDFAVTDVHYNYKAGRNLKLELSPVSTNPGITGNALRSSSLQYSQRRLSEGDVIIPVKTDEGEELQRRVVLPESQILGSILRVEFISRELHHDEHRGMVSWLGHDEADPGLVMEFAEETRRMAPPRSYVQEKQSFDPHLPDFAIFYLLLYLRSKLSHAKREDFNFFLYLSSTEAHDLERLPIWTVFDVRLSVLADAKLKKNEAIDN